MKEITLALYWMGRDKKYASELTPEIVANATEMCKRANALLALFYMANPGEKTDRGVNSGWRPPAVNAAIKNAAKKSNHMLAKAIDIADADGKLDAWLMTDAGQKALEDIGLWMEHPSATRGWCHVQTVPPRSGRRVFHP